MIDNNDLVMINDREKWKELYDKFDGRYDDLVTECLRYMKAYDFLIEYWDSIADEQKPELHKKLQDLRL